MSNSEMSNEEVFIFTWLLNAEQEDMALVGVGGLLRIVRVLAKRVNELEYRLEALDHGGPWKTTKD